MRIIWTKNRKSLHCTTKSPVFEWLLVGELVAMMALSLQTVFQVIHFRFQEIQAMPYIGGPLSSMISNLMAAVLGAFIFYLFLAVLALFEQFLEQPLIEIQTKPGAKK